MKYDSVTEQTIADSIAPPIVRREDIRNWVVDAQVRIRRQRVGRTVFAVMLFASMAIGLGFIIDQRVRSIRQLVEERPLRSVVILTELTMELCNEKPAVYFVDQLSKRKSSRPDGLASVRIQ